MCELQLKIPARCKRVHLGRRTNKARNMRNSRAERIDEQIQQEKENAHVSMSQLRASHPQ